MIQEFKEFITKGNLVELAVAFVMGLAFAALVTSFVDDIVMQLIAAIFGQPDFAGISIHWGAAIGVDPDSGSTLYESQIFIGRFINATITFIVVAFVMYLVIKAYNKYQAAEDPGPSEVDLLTEIRDSLSTSSTS